MVSKELIKDLKQADNVSIRINGNTATLKTRINEKKNHKTGWVKPEVVKEHNNITAYLPIGFNEVWFWDHYKDLYGFEALSLLLKIGDKLTFNVTVNNNGYLDKAKIPADAWSGKDRYCHGTYDELYHEVITARIVRKNKVIVNNLHIADQISVNNSARLLK